MSIGRFGSKLLWNRSCFDSLEGNLFDGLSWIEVVGWFAIEVVCWFRLVNFSGTLGEGPSEQNLTKEKKHEF